MNYGTSTMNYKLSCHETCTKKMISAEKIAELNGHANPIFTLEVSQKPGILFTGGNDKGVVEWSLKDQAFIKVMFPVTASVYAIHCPAGFPYMFAGLRNGDVLVFDFLKQQLLPPLKHHAKPVFDIQSVKSKQELLIAAEDGTVSVWSLKTLNHLHTIKVSDDTIRCIAVSPNEKQLAFGCRNNQIAVYDPEDYALLKTIHGHTMSVFALGYSPAGDVLISGGRDAQVKIWDSSTGNLIHNIPAHLFAVNSIAFHPQLPYFATASMDKSIKIWGADDFKLYKTISREKGLAAHQLSVNKIKWNGDRLISVSDDKRAMIWEINFDV